MEKLKEIFARIQFKNTSRSIQNLVIFALIGISLILAGSFFFKENDHSEARSEDLTENSSYSDYETRMTMQLEQILSAIDGVGKVEVMLTIANESESEIAYSITESQSTTQENDNQGGQRIIDQNNSSETAVMVNEGGGNKPFITRENRPEIKGVMVVADGAQIPEIKYQLNQAVQTALDLPSHKVVIYARKK